MNDKGTAKGLPDNLSQLREFKPGKMVFTRQEIQQDERVQGQLITANTFCGLYFVVNAGGGKIEDINRINGFFCEDDVLSIEEQHGKLDAFSLLTSIRLNTGKSVHAYWLPPVENKYSPHDFRLVQKRLIQHFGSDPQLHNPNRVMRVPTFNHVVWNHETGELNYKRIELVEFEPSRRYSMDQMLAALPEAIRNDEVQTESPLEMTIAEPKPEKKEQPASGDMSAYEERLRQVGVYSTWEELNGEARRRLMLHPSATLKDGYVHVKGICHKGNGPSAIHINVETGAYACQLREEGCPTAKILKALNLPEKPDTAAKPAEAVVRNAYANLGELLDTEFPPIVEVLKYIERGTVSQFCASTSAGKSTLLLNACLALAGGQQFLPLVPEGGTPRKVMYVDFEANAPKLKEGLNFMLEHPTYRLPEVNNLVRLNFKPLVDIEIDDMPLNLSIHLDYVRKQAQEFGAELVIIDNISAGFELENDNSNTEVASKVMRPLKNIANKANAAVILVHHKGKSSEGSKSTVDAMVGRGASNFGNLSRTIYALVPEAEMGEGFVVLHNTKGKCGPLLEPVTLRLDFNTLWFSPVQGVQKKDLTGEAIRDFVLLNDGASIGEIKEHFMGHGFSDTTIGRKAVRAEAANLIQRKNQKAKYYAVEGFLQAGATQSNTGH